MKSTAVTKLSGVAALLLAIGLVACSDDSSNGGDGGGDASLDRGGLDGDTGTDVPGLDQGIEDQGGDTPAFECSRVNAGSSLGQACDTEAADFCAPPGGRCIGLQAGGAQCFQACIPDQCEDLCAESEVCVPLEDPNGDPVLYEPGGPAMGACVMPVTGDQGAYDECSEAVGACQAGLTCLTLIGIDGAAFCSPSCSDSNPCPSREGVDGTCVLGESAQNPTNCGLLCDEANAGTATGCPAGMICTATGQGAGICLFPAN